MRAEEKGVDILEVPASGPENLVIERDVLSYEGAGAVKATPLAKKVAHLEGVELAEVSGSGSHGKITREDILAAVAARSAAAGGGTQRGERVIPMKGMR
ncbi:E3 binding domain-containing protein, partial [Christensenella hongkongensis]|uniref:E3 binding domain-containing protein n=1 Tax=Christensenella hongkongensis TaxID=270498 RepID=UPI0006238534